MEGQDKPVNFGDPMYAVTSVGREWVHVKPGEVSRSLAAFEEGLRIHMRGCTARS